MLLDKKFISNYIQTNNDSTIQLRQAYAVTGKVNDNYINNIKVAFKENVNDKWKKATIEAIKEWKSIPGCKIKFTTNFTGTADVLVCLASSFNISMDQYTLAKAELPKNGIPGKYVFINDKSQNYDYSTESSCKETIAHELGHTLGFKHTDWSATETNSLIAIPNTSKSDAGSIMNTHAKGEWPTIGFSAHDELAARYLYPGELITTNTKYVVNDGTGTVTYTIANNSERRATWQAFENAELKNISVDGRTAIFSIPKGASGAVVISVTYTYVNNNQKLCNIKNSSVWAGVPPRPILDEFGTSTSKRFNMNGLYTLQASQQYKETYGITDYKFSILGNATIVDQNPYTGNLRVLTGYSKSSSSFSLGVTATNSSGSTTTWFTGNMYSSNNGSGIPNQSIY